MAKKHYCSLFVLSLALIPACSVEPAQKEEVSTAVQSLTAYEVDGNFETPDTFVVQPGPGEDGFDWRYTFTNPGTDWEEPAFVDANWQSGDGGFFGGGSIAGDHATTTWPASAPELWARSTFTLTAEQIDDLMIWGRWDDSLIVYINGKHASGEPAADMRNWSNTYRYVGLTQEARDSLEVGTNTIAVHVKDVGGGRYMDLGLTLSPEMAHPPVNGVAPNPAFDEVTEFMRQEMSAYGVPAGMMAIGHGSHEDSRIVLSQGFGYMDKQFSREVQPDAVLRLASLDKIITEDVVKYLISENEKIGDTNDELELSTFVYDVFEAYDVHPISQHDSRMEQVTIQQLLDHTSGVGELPGEQDLDQFYADLGVEPGTSTREDNIEWILAQPLQWNPGVPTVDDPYSSAGYMMLRHVVQLMTGDLLGYIQNDFLGPTGNSDIFISAQRIENRIKYADDSLREPWYAHFYEPRDLWVYFENYTGLSGTAEAFVSFLQHNRGYGVSYGGLPAVQTVAGRFETAAGDEITYAVFFNLSGQLRFDIRDDDGNLIEQNFDGDLRQMLAELPASAWEEPVEPGQGSVSCSMSGTRNWGSGFETTLTVQNVTSEPVEDWQLRMDFNQPVSMFGNGEASPTYDGNSVTLTQQWYRPPLAAGASITFNVGGNFPSPQPFVPPSCTGL